MAELETARDLARRAVLFALPALMAAVCVPYPVLAGPPGFVWRIADISASVVRDDEVLGIGQYLLLEQALRAGESGWMEMKIDLPEHWNVTKVATEGDAVRVYIEREPKAFALTRENVGAISARLLEGAGRKADVELASIWRDAAEVQPAADAQRLQRPDTEPMADSER